MFALRWSNYSSEKIIFQFFKFKNYDKGVDNLIPLSPLIIF